MRWSWRAPLTVTSPPVATGGRRERRDLDAVGQHPVGGAVHGVDALDDDAAVDVDEDHRAHLLQEQDEVDHLGLDGGVLDDRGALGRDRGEHQVLGGADRRVGQAVVAADQPIAAGHERGRGVVDLGAHASRPSTWKSTGRSPMRQPPTSGTLASPTRFSSGPMKRIGMRFTPEYCSETTEDVIVGVHTRRVSSSSHSAWVPSSRSMPRMTSTSVMRGTFDSTHGLGRQQRGHQLLGHRLGPARGHLAVERPPPVISHTGVDVPPGIGAGRRRRRRTGRRSGR